MHLPFMTGGPLSPVRDLRRLAGALAVILTGTGHDAQAGVRAVAHCGGTVLAQDQATAKYHSRPAAAIATGLVHQVLPPGAIADAIVRHVHHA